MELFDKLILEVEFEPDCYTTTAFFMGLKTEIQLYMVRKRPGNFRDLMALTITLDKERSGSYKSE